MKSNLCKLTLMVWDRFDDPCSTNTFSPLSIRMIFEILQDAPFLGIRVGTFELLTHDHSSDQPWKNALDMERSSPSRKFKGLGLGSPPML